MDETDLQSQLDDQLGPDYNADINNQNPNTDALTNTTTGGNTNNTSLNSILNTVGGVRGLANLFSGAYGAYATNNQGNAQQQIANQLLNNADPYRQYRQQAEIPFMLGQMQQYGDVQNAQNNLLGLLSTRASATNPDIQAVRDRLKTMDAKLGGDYDTYSGLLKQAYNNPLQYYNSSEYQGLANQLGQQIARRDAAAGRNSQYGTRAVEMQNNFLNQLDKYRTGLNSAAGTAGGLQAQNYAAGLQGLTNLQNADTNSLQGLAGLYGQLTNNLNYLGGIVTPRGTAGAGAGQAANLSTQGTAYNNAALAPLLSSVVQSFGS